MRTYKGNVAWWLVVIIAVVALAVGLVIGMKLKSTNATSEPTVSPSISSTISALPSVSNSPISTADWKTYTNATYGFTFKYPKDWTLESKDSNNKLLSISLTSSEPPDGAPIDMSVSIYKSYKDLDVNKLGVSSLKDYLDKYTTSRTDVDGIPSYSSVISIIFAKQNSYKSFWSNGFGGGEYSLFTTLKNGNILEFFDMTQNINTKAIEDSLQFTE